MTEDKTSPSSSLAKAQRRNPPIIRKKGKGNSNSRLTWMAAAVVVAVAVAASLVFSDPLSLLSSFDVGSLHASKPGLSELHMTTFDEYISDDASQPLFGQTAFKFLIHPVSVSTFWEQHAEKAAFIARRPDTYVKPLDSSLEHIDMMLSIQAVYEKKGDLMLPDGSRTQAGCSYVKHGMSSLNENYTSPHHAYLDGCTIVCHIVPTYWTPLAALMKGLRTGVGWGFMANMYLTPRKSQGFTPHTDNKDGFILQADGRKQWILQSTTFTKPLRNQTVGRPWQASYETVAGPMVANVTVTAGDLLFVPRGQIHHAMSAEGSPSLHYTISPVKSLEWAPFLGSVVANSSRADSLSHAIERLSSEPQNDWLRSSLPHWAAILTKEHTDHLETLKEQTLVIINRIQMMLQDPEDKKELEALKQDIEPHVVRGVRETQVYLQYVRKLENFGIKQDMKMMNGKDQLERNSEIERLKEFKFTVDDDVLTLHLGGDAKDVSLRYTPELEESVKFMSGANSPFIVDQIPSSRDDFFESACLIRILEDAGVVRVEESFDL